MKLKIGGKLAAAFIVIVGLSVLVGALGIIQIRSVVSADGYLYQKMAVPLADLIRIAEDFQRLRINVRTVATSSDEKGWASAREEIKRLNAEIDAANESFESTMVTERGAAMFLEYKKQLSEYRSAAEEITRLAAAGKRAEALDLMGGRGAAAAAALQNAVNAIVETKIGLSKQTAEKNAADGSRATVILIVINVVSAVFAALIAFRHRTDQQGDDAARQRSPAERQRERRTRGNVRRAVESGGAARRCHRILQG